MTTQPRIPERYTCGGCDNQWSMFLTDGIWQSVEEPADRGLALRKWREGQLFGGDAA
jgi:hypothetical protein